MTFERAIIDAQAAFAHGQVYVALSRCKSFEGIVLRSPIGFGSIKTDGLVKNYSVEAERNAPDAAHLFAAKKQYEQDLIEELFNFRIAQSALNDLLKQVMEHQPKLNTPVLPKVLDWETHADKLLFSTAAKFAPKLMEYFVSPDLPTANVSLMERLQKASQYFGDCIHQSLVPILNKVGILSDNQEVKRKVDKAMNILKKELFLKVKCFEEVVNKGFAPKKYLQTKRNAAQQFAANQKIAQGKPTLTIPNEVPHPELYKELYHWRSVQAATLKRLAHEVISTTTLVDLTKKLPTKKSTLLKVKGLGRAKAKTFGKAILELIDDFCYRHQLAANLINDDHPTPKVVNELPKAYSVDGIRKTHPKAYAPWTEEEEKELVQLKAEDQSVHYIAGVMGRKRGAIYARLKKLEEGLTYIAK